MRKAFEEFAMEAMRDFDSAIEGLGYSREYLKKAGVARVEVSRTEGHELPFWEIYIDGDDESYLPLPDATPQQAAAYAAGFANGRLNFPIIGGVPYARRA